MLETRQPLKGDLREHSPIRRGKAIKKSTKIDEELGTL
jgi:hypothetical protein